MPKWPFWPKWSFWLKWPNLGSQPAPKMTRTLNRVNPRRILAKIALFLIGRFGQNPPRIYPSKALTRPDSQIWNPGKLPIKWAISQDFRSWDLTWPDQISDLTSPVQGPRGHWKADRPTLSGTSPSHRGPGPSKDLGQLWGPDPDYSCCCVAAMSQVQNIYVLDLDQFPQSGD